MAYQSIFERMNRTEKRKFEQLSKEEKAEIFRTELGKTATDKMKDELINSVLVGYETACRIFAENYVLKYLEEDNEEKAVAILNDLLAEIMKGYKAVKAKDKKQEETK